ncbi:MAG: hypothetical protein ACTS5V_04630 [Giesbergeria sp.]
MSSSNPLETSLAEVESLLAKVGKALENFQADDLQQASTKLRDAALHFSQVLDTHRAEALAPAIAVRVRTVGARLASQRDGLARLATLVDKQVATVLPHQAPPSTYGPRAVGQGVGVARIYKSAG